MIRLRIFIDGRARATHWVRPERADVTAKIILLNLRSIQSPGTRFALVADGPSGLTSILWRRTCPSASVSTAA